jgi:hypothetical protein
MRLDDVDEVAFCESSEKGYPHCRDGVTGVESRRNAKYHYQKDPHPDLIKCQN